MHKPQPSSLSFVVLHPDMTDRCPLNRDQLRRLFLWFKSRLSPNGERWQANCDGSRHYLVEWLLEEALDLEPTILWFRSQSCVCDCSIVASMLGDDWQGTTMGLRDGDD